MSCRTAFYPFRALARKVAGDKLRVIKIVGAAARKAHKDPGVLKEVWVDLQTLLQMLKAWAVGGYREIPTRSLVLAIAALLYFLSPIDAILDILPGGFVDDVAVLGAVIVSLKADIDAFRKWRGSKEPTPGGPY